MSVLISVKVPGDVSKFRDALTERADEFKAITERSKGIGALHHRFGMGADYMLVVDEWQSAEQFESFFAAPELQAFIGEIGASGQPEISITEAISDTQF